MRNTIHTNHCALRPYQERHIIHNLDKLSKHLGSMFDGESSSIKVELTQDEHAKSQADRFLCELTIFLPNKVVLRSHQRSLSIEASFDLAMHKIDRQVRKTRTKHGYRNRARQLEAKLMEV